MIENKYMNKNEKNKKKTMNFSQHFYGQLVLHIQGGFQRRPYLFVQMSFRRRFTQSAR
jgi:hypothetical protein